MIIARELTGDVKLLVVAQPTRGLDVGSIEFIHRRIIEIRDQGAAVLLVSAELDEVLTLADRIGVIYRGDARRPVRPGRGHPRQHRPLHGQRRTTRRRWPDGRAPRRPTAAPTRPPWPRAAPHRGACSPCSSRSTPCSSPSPWRPSSSCSSAATPSRPTGRCSTACSARPIASTRRSAGPRRSSARRWRWRSRSGPACSTSAPRASSSSAPPPPRGSARSRWIADVPGPIAHPDHHPRRRRSAARFWGGIPGVLKAKTGAHEVITTIMLNSIAVLVRALDGDLAGPGDPARPGRVGAPHRRPLPDVGPAARADRHTSRPSTSGSSSPSACACWCGSSCGAPPSASRSAPSAPTPTPPSTRGWA